MYFCCVTVNEQAERERERERERDGERERGGGEERGGREGTSQFDLLTVCQTSRTITYITN